MRKACKYRIYPSRSQITRLENQFSMCRHLYNWSLQERMDAYQNQGKSISYNQQQNSLPELKRSRPWFKGVHSQVLQDTLQRLDGAFQHFFRRVKSGEKKPGFPRFKKRGQWNSITYPQFQFRPFAQNGNMYIQVPKVGELKLVFHREIPWYAGIKTLTIKREGDKWFACFSMDTKTEPSEPKRGLRSPIGIDLGLIDLFYASNGDHSWTPKYYRELQKHLARLQRKFSRTKKYTRKWYKLLKALRKTHYRIRCKREDFLHKEANRLLSKSDVIFHEDLNVQGMIRRPAPKQDENGQYLSNGACWKSGLNKSIADASWGKFLRLLRYKAKQYGKAVVAVPPYYTSQECPRCGTIVKKSLSTRTHDCECGFRANRDYTAALNILRVGLDTFPTVPPLNNGGTAG